MQNVRHLDNSFKLFNFNILTFWPSRDKSSNSGSDFNLLIACKWIIDTDIF